MPVDYKELRQEIKEITTIDGFVASCLEIKESMFFYERDLVLAAYTASLELLIAAALFSAALEGPGELEATGREISRRLDELRAELNRYQLPLDIQYLADRYSEEKGYQTSLRLPVYLEMVRQYSADTNNGNYNLDQLLRKAQQSIYSNKSTGHPELKKILGQVGAAMLRGAKLRPLWLEISHHYLRLILLGLQTLTNNLRVTPYFTFPLGDITTERQKRKKIGGNVVLDLGAFRNFREGGSGYTDLNPALSSDDVDEFLENLFQDQKYLKEEPDQDAITMITAVLEAGLVNAEIKESYLLTILVYSDLWKLYEISDVILEFLAGWETEEPLYSGFWALLRGFGSKALPAARRYARSNRSSPFLAELADFLAREVTGKRRWSLLKEIFEHYPHQDETKAQIALSIARSGDLEAVPYLKEALAGGSDLGHSYQHRLRKALQRAQNEAGAKV
ncbi:MAG: hypothetical protein GX335_09045 [Firmicutes bacterium]|nr:hypothetical protein [Bacillota bacterium]